GGGQLAPRQALVSEVAPEPAPERRQRLTEPRQTGELRGVAHGGPARMVEVLFAPRLVTAGGLQVPPRVLGDPDLTPSRRDHQLLDTLAFGRAHRRAIGPVVAEAPTAPAPAEAGLVVGDVAQAGAGGGFRRGLTRRCRAAAHRLLDR